MCACLQALVASIRANNAPPIPASRALGLQNRSQVDEYMMAHPDGGLCVCILFLSHCCTASSVLAMQKRSRWDMYIMTHTQTLMLLVFDCRCPGRCALHSVQQPVSWLRAAVKRHSQILQRQLSRPHRLFCSPYDQRSWTSHCTALCQHHQQQQCQ